MKTQIILTILVLGSWVLLTVITFLFHGKKINLSIIKYDYFRVIPHWKMFAGSSPGISQVDYFIVYRDLLKSGKTTEWIDLIRIYPTFVRWLWNPFFIKNNLIFNYSRILSNLDTNTPLYFNINEQIKEMILSEPKIKPDSIARQFSVVQVEYNFEKSMDYFSNKNSDFYGFT